MSTNNPAAPMLRRASRLLHEQATELERSFSIGGMGRIWPQGTEAERQRRDELRDLSLRLKDLSSAFGRSRLNRKLKGHPVLQDIAA
jgi:hypothetical protein